jgi:transposase
MLTMDKVHDIRSRFFNKGEGISQIADALQVDRKTVRKYVDMTDFNVPQRKSTLGKNLCPKLDPYKSTIDDWLKADKEAPRKQRHTAKRVYDRLKSEVAGFDCSYRTVATYYAIKRKEIFAGRVGYLPLDHKPGEAQIDFGAAEYYENGRKVSGHYLNVSFPYSNKGYLQLFPGENMECLLEGMDAIFRYIGCVPAEVWFDNTKTIVTKIIRGGDREVTDRFSRFREHYRFEAVFTNPGEGHEKGNVECKVGYHRRNLLVPVPRILSLADFNRQLLQMCDDDADREHYRYDDLIEERFAEDLKHCHPLPEIPFDLSGNVAVRTNKWGKFFLNKGMHEYSASPKHSSSVVNVQLTSALVIVLDENYREIVRHSRLYGDTKQHSMEWLPYLQQLSIRPRALKYSGIYDLMPPPMKKYLEGCSNAETGKVLKVLAELTERTGFESALGTVTQALCYDATDADSLRNLYRRLYSDVPELPPMPLGSAIPDLGQMPANLVSYDSFLKTGGITNAGR